MQPWIKVVINHFWWCCASCKGDVTELREKWFSILFHITNRHRWSGNKVYKKCEHAELSKRDQLIKKWLNEGSPAFKALENAVKDKYLVRDLKYLTDFNHTGNLEVYHSLYNKYCPKRLHFSYGGTIARSQLAVLDFNSGSVTTQAKTGSGELRYKQQYSKITESWVVKNISIAKVRDYTKDITSEVEHLVSSQEECLAPDVGDVPKNIAPTEKPDKKDDIQNICTRFVL